MDDPLAISLKTPEVSLISNRKVQNEFPSIDVPYKLAVIGEAPGADEEAHGRPFIGASGRLLDSILNGVGILRQGCFIGNICKYRPPSNRLEDLGFDHPKVVEGWNELKDELRIYSPNCILALGNTALRFLCGHGGILQWRGSILKTEFGKVVPSIHPAAVLREYKQWVLLRFDTLRARQEADSPVLTLPSRLLETELSADEICRRLDNWPAGLEAGFDIEGGLEAFPCCAISDRPDRGFVIAWSRYSDTDQGRIYVSLSRFLYREDVPKVLQTSLYDRFVLAYGYHMLIRSVRHDTMLKHWELYPEASGGDATLTTKKKRGLGKGLDVITSIWTRESYYKHERASTDPATFHRYNIKDACCTLEASKAQDQAISGNALRHYRFNMDLLSPLLYMELRGIRYDSKTAAEELSNVRTALAECSSRLVLRAGCELTGKGGSLSPSRLKRVLYQEKGYPEQKTGRGPDASVTTNVEALLNLSKKFPYDSFISDILLHRKLESVKETLEITADPDGRVRCGYNLVGTETGRLTCYTSPTGSGANLQTITKKLRKLYLADEDHWLFQCDLSGADGWTVAAHCIRHGDPTMWDDYQFGLKPARIIALMYEHGSEATKCSREELKERCKEVDDEGWLYFACKRIQHASNYGVQERTVARQIMVDSYKITGVPVYVDNQTCAALQRLYFVRYPGVYMWHHWAKREVVEGRNLTAASGHTRTFFGRRKSWDSRSRSFGADHETWKEYLADEPQENTTYADNLALLKLWNDPENRVEGKRLKIEPLHAVHDSLIGQFHKSLTAWALPKIRSYFDNELHIATMKVVIPFEGRYGISWGNLTQGVI
jgi:uracil-DNA glycosylase family 4